MDDEDFEDNPEEDDPTEDESDEDEPEEETPLLDKDEPSMEKLLFRETVRKHIDGILAEPEDRDEETLAVLKNLKVYWLNLLSQTTIETILVMTNSPVNCNIKNK